MNSAGHDKVAERFTARSMEAGTVHQIVFATMKRHYYSANGEDLAGTGLYQNVSRAEELLSAVLPLDMFFPLAVIPFGRSADPGERTVHRASFSA